MKTILLNNQTHYNSRDLTKLFATVLKEYKRVSFNFKFDTVRVKCIYRRTKDGFCGGYAYYHNNIVVMKLPKSKMPYDSDTFEQRIARTFHHELDHCRGMKHGEMIKDSSRRLDYIGAEFHIKENGVKAKPVKTTDTKIESLLKRKKSWESKRKRCETALKKLAKQIKYYEKKKSQQIPAETV